MHDLAKSLDVLTRLRIKGLKLSIDDFGTGYSSMVQLYRAPFTEIKIDKSFVMQATKDAEAQAIVDITILLGNRLGMTVVSEGVEDQEAWDLLSGLGCDTAQGYFIARPMPSDQLLEWASSQKAPASSCGNSQDT
ncbi:MAG: EAL domain-containing protein [Gammaproteobacteria bacterium]|nr:EAL domain-containing protein [Gammaproteobacteria bacterium]